MSKFKLIGFNKEDPYPINPQLKEHFQIDENGYVSPDFLVNRFIQDYASNGVEITREEAVERIKESKMFTEEQETVQSSPEQEPQASVS